MENVTEVVAEFEERLSTEVRRQKRIDKIEYRNFR